MEIKNNLIITNTFHKQVIENKAKLADNMKVLIYEDNNKIFGDWTFKIDAVCLQDGMSKMQK